MTERQRLQQEMTELEKRIDERIALLMEKLLEHFAYHKENESRWGVIKLMRDHPFKTMFAGVFIGIIIALTVPAISGKDVFYWIIRFFK